MSRDRLSPRALRLLEQANRTEVVSDRAEVAAKLRACGRPVFDAALDFQRDYGGLSWGPSHALGIVFIPPSREPGAHPVGPDEPSMIPIGSIVGSGDTDAAYIDASGRVVTEYGMKSATVAAYIEQAAMLEVPPWSRRLDLTVRPPLGARLAGALGLALVPEPSDAHQTWWRSEDIELRHLQGLETPESTVDLLQAGITASIARAIEVAAALDPEVGVSVSDALGVSHVYLSASEAEALPSVASWAAIPGAVRYPMTTMWEDVRGVLWVVPGPKGPSIHSYRLDELGRAVEQYSLDDQSNRGWIIQQY